MKRIFASVFLLAVTLAEADDVNISGSQINLLQKDTKGVTMAMAMAAVPSVPNSIGAGYGQFERKKGGVIGINKTVDPDDRIMVRLIGGQAGNKKAGTIGASWQFQ